jgi:hypothetical protein
MERGEYLSRAREFCPRGSDLPQAKLNKEKVLFIRSAAVQRENLRKHISDNLTTKALAEKFGVTERTVEKVLQRYTWVHV